MAAASVLAKTTRDAYMAALAQDHPQYGWEINKGYATPGHRAALRAVGPSPHHRLSWRLGVDQTETELERQDGALMVLEELQLDLGSLERHQCGLSQEVRA